MDAVLSLQQTAGNRATTARLSSLVIQRDLDDSQLEVAVVDAMSRLAGNRIREYEDFSLALANPPERVEATIGSGEQLLAELARSTQQGRGAPPPTRTITFPGDVSISSTARKVGSSRGAIGRSRVEFVRVKGAPGGAYTDIVGGIRSTMKALNRNRSTPLDDRDVGAAMGGILHGDDPAKVLGVDGSDEIAQKLLNAIGSLFTLVFVVESERNPAALAAAAMTTQLLADGDITLEQAFAAPDHNTLPGPQFLGGLFGPSMVAPGKGKAGPVQGGRILTAASGYGDLEHGGQAYYSGVGLEESKKDSREAAESLMGRHVELFVAYWGRRQGLDPAQARAELKKKDAAFIAKEVELALERQLGPSKARKQAQSSPAPSSASSWGWPNIAQLFGWPNQ